MAVTKIHPIKSTLKKALDYIENPDKTDEKLFVSSYGCSYETADRHIYFLMFHKHFVFCLPYYPPNLILILKA